MRNFRERDYNRIRHKKIAESLGIEPDYNKSNLHIHKIDSLFKSLMGFLIVLIVAIIFKLNFTIALVDGPSMLPTLKDGQIIVLKKEELKRFDIVGVVERLEDGGEAKNIVKRVIGLPGDHITVIDGILYINNSKFEESYLDANNIVRFKQVNFDIIVPEGKIFVLGDNRDVSADSRAVGSFDKEAVIGTKIFGFKFW